MKKLLNKKDTVFLCVFAVFSAALCFFTYFSPLFSQSESSSAVVSRSGKIVCEMDLSKNGTFLIEDIGFEVTVRDGYAFVSRSKCPCRVCVNSGRISRAGAAIICVPNEITIAIKGTGDIDGVAG